MFILFYIITGKIYAPYKLNKGIMTADNITRNGGLDNELWKIKLRTYEQEYKKWLLTNGIGWSLHHLL